MDQQKLIAAIKRMEERLHRSDVHMREEITGPILDAIFDENTILRKEIEGGLTFDFYYRTKIARDFWLAEPDLPDHVWEPQTTKLLTILARQAKDVLIGGAYFGDQALIVAKQILPQDGTVHCFEPNKAQFHMLQHNAERNGLGNVKAWRLGLWKNEEGKMKLIGEDSFAHAELVSEQMEEDSAVFSTTSIDTYVKEQGIGKLDLILLDIEGLEQTVLQGAESQLNLPAGEAPNIIFEVHRNYVDWSNGLDQSDIVKYLQSFGYHIFALRDYNSNVAMTGKPVEIIPPDRVYLEGPPHGFNMIAVKNLSALDDPQIKICYDVSPKLLTHKKIYLHQPTE
ncbi:FkbM family methyltransferase [Paenibacillus glycanilyticus]|uniref:FkbM family methyltransferase n=1 Tax=Paenibacillus glycanilyticus TaxID=126569 RepID=UPI00203F205E|nr:FkbM family methyltransferase [Paenibacillus glycanilyticus]MCM3629224.1 FkbM family methyltransferase [Paenibacillus glycanilyticus]